MPSLLCKCGERILDGRIPHPNEHVFISDVAYGAYMGQIDAEQLYLDMKSMLLCPHCGRLWVYWEGFSQPPTCYGKEA